MLLEVNTVAASISATEPTPTATSISASVIARQLPPHPSPETSYRRSCRSCQLSLTPCFSGVFDLQRGTETVSTVSTKQTRNPDCTALQHRRATIWSSPVLLCFLRLLL